MSTYSLNLRGELNRRLSINEMDGNFLYLQELALSGTASTIDLTSLTTDSGSIYFDGVSTYLNFPGSNDWAIDL